MANRAYLRVWTRDFSEATMIAEFARFLTTALLAAASEGHFVADVGFEHLFTGHGGILAPAAATNPFDNSDHPIEKTFRSWMSLEANRKEYAGKTRENIQHLMNWLEAVSRALPVEGSEWWGAG